MTQGQDTKIINVTNIQANISNPWDTGNPQES